MHEFLFGPENMVLQESRIFVWVSLSTSPCGLGTKGRRNLVPPVGRASRLASVRAFGDWPLTSPVWREKSDGYAAQKRL